MAILVTGAAGFIGSDVVRMLLANGEEVIGIDNMNDYYAPALKWHRLEQNIPNPKFTFIEGDVESLEALRPIFEKHNITAIVNLAARAGVRYSLENPYIYAQTNFTGAVNLLEMARQFGVKQYQMASTSSIYGGCPLPYTEDQNANFPISPYAATKRAAEMIAYTYHYQYGINVVINRYFTVYGPAGRPDMSILKFIHMVDIGKPFVLYGDGSQKRDFTYIEDIARGTIASLNVKGYEIINLGGGKQPVTINYLIQLIEEGLGKPALRDLQPFHAADMFETGANIQKAKEMLNWEPTVDLEEGISRTIAWYKANREFLIATL